MCNVLSGSEVGGPEIDIAYMLADTQLTDNNMQYIAIKNIMSGLLNHVN